MIDLFSQDTIATAAWIHHPLFIPLLTAVVMTLMLIVMASVWRHTSAENEARNAEHERIRRQQETLLSMARSSALTGGDIILAMREITELSVGALGADFASVWSYDEGRSEFRLEDRYSISGNTHRGGDVCDVRQYPQVFPLLDGGRTVAVEDCTNDVQFNDVIVAMAVPGTRSAVIAPFMVCGKAGGAVVVSQIHQKRPWKDDEVHFVAEVAGQVSHLFINADRNRSEEALIKARNELEVRVQDRTAELSRKNEELQREIAERLRAEKERQLLETQILQAQKLESLAVMAGGVAHDFNNILMAILGNVEMAKSEIPSGSPTGEYLQDIDEAAHRAVALARQMLAYSGRGHAVVQPIDLNRLVQDMMRILESSIGANARIQCDLEESLPTVDGDSAQIGQVLMNLVINGVEAIENGSGNVMVRTGTIWCDNDMFSAMWLKERLPEGRYVFLDVSDSGCGMNPETLSRIFDPFFTTKFTGRGLGLAAVLGIVRGHHGAIDVCSEIGKGSTFRILLPAGRTAQAPAEDKTVPSRTTPGWGTILLVDDEAPMRVLGKRMLERLGYKVQVASDGLEAISMFQDHRQDIRCVLMDLAMPRMDGKKALESLRAIDPGVKVIMSSGFSEDDLVAKFQDWNLAGILPKPYVIDALSARLRAALGD